MLKSLAVVTAATAALVATPAIANNHTDGRAAAKSMRCAAIPAGAADKLFNEFNAAWATRNPDTVTNLFSSDAVLLATVSNTPRTDRAAIRDYFDGFLKNAPVGVINTSNIREGCNMLVRTGTWTVNLTNPDTRVVTPVNARYSFIYKYEGGRWKIAHLHSSMMPEIARD